MNSIKSFILLALFSGLLVSCSNTKNNNQKALNDEELLNLVQHKTFNYFWEGSENNSGMARERIHMDEVYPENDKDVVTSGGSGFGVMAILVGIERNFITRDEGIERLNKIVSFLEKADTFHGLFPHWWYGNTGKAKGFSDKDNGGDVVETAFMMQGLLTAHQYLINGNNTEKALAERINKLWSEANWDWYRNGKDVLFWHWSPQHEFGMNHPIRGFDECIIAYILAVSSPTYPVPTETYHKGWARNGEILGQHTIEEYPIGINYNNKFGIGPLFWIHYSFLGLDPRELSDKYSENYFAEFKNYTLINRAYCIRNPKGYKGYGSDSWGLTASYSVNGYNAHAPNEEQDLGVIAPTAALSSIVYTPDESMDVMRYLYSKRDTLLGTFGFYDAYSESENWYPKRYLAIDQGPIVVMIENYRSQLLWNLFMSHPDIQKGLKLLGFNSPHLNQTRFIK
ncbi:beta-glucosidase [Dysgonomonas sp. Marseille-P4677]|uniref:glucoamylase family protein n=1 Tax=Dysgonomonas sp. Marseille-P4677 TaxID=2364790 RepID=UPI0019116494|nr:glucoamylase family protein [Dysgonomonas sp. Marseille-P4677]MBK5719832.1 beta-glucosidase [Dysgonomonas sp. Marseille-P4677]